MDSLQPNWNPLLISFYGHTITNSYTSWSGGSGISTERVGSSCSPRSFLTGMRWNIFVRGDNAEGFAIRQLAEYALFLKHVNVHLKWLCTQYIIRSPNLQSSSKFKPLGIIRRAQRTLVPSSLALPSIKRSSSEIHFAILLSIILQISSSSFCVLRSFSSAFKQVQPNAWQCKHTQP